jgi:hypothetical protein
MQMTTSISWLIRRTVAIARGQLQRRNGDIVEDWMAVAGMGDDHPRSAFATMFRFEQRRPDDGDLLQIE